MKTSTERMIAKKDGPIGAPWGKRKLKRDEKSQHQ
jgi:hypothetical protein